MNILVGSPSSQGSGCRGIRVDQTAVQKLNEIQGVAGVAALS